MMYVGCEAGGREVSGTNLYGEQEVVVLPHTDLVATPQHLDRNTRHFIERSLRVHGGHRLFAFPACAGPSCLWMGLRQVS
jgi:hypothetical protein